MSADDRRFMDRLLEAGRRDAAPDEAARQARISEGVLARGSGGGGGGGGLAGPRTLRSWGGLTAVGLGALALVGAGAFAQSAPVSKTSDVGAAGTPAALDVAAVPAVDAPPSVEAAASLGTSVWELPSVPASKKAPAAPSVETDDLAVELAALESARRKLRERDPAGAMKLLDAFDRRFPRPRVGDEATVLRVEVLFALGHDDAARRLGRDFMAQHPDSIYRARVAQLLGGATP